MYITVNDGETGDSTADLPRPQPHHNNCTSQPDSQTTAPTAPAAPAAPTNAQNAAGPDFRVLDSHIPINNTANNSKDQPCYCFLMESGLECNTYANETQLTQPRRKATPTVQQPPVIDSRGDREILRDILLHLNQMVRPEFKAMVDKKISRDSGQKEVKDGVYSTTSLLRKQVEEWKRLTKNDELEKEIIPPQNVKDKEVIHINVNPITSAKLPMINIYMKKNQNKVFLPAVVDSGSSKFCIPHTYMDQLGIKISDLQHRNKYTLNTSTQTGDKSSILGMCPLILILFDNEAREHRLEVEVIFVRTPLTVALMDWGFLKKHRFAFSYPGGIEHLELHLRPQAPGDPGPDHGGSGNDKILIPTLERQQGDHARAILTNLNDVEAHEDKTSSILFKGPLQCGTFCISGKYIKNTYIQLSQQVDGEDSVFPVQVEMTHNASIRPGGLSVEATPVSELETVISHHTEVRDTRDPGEGLDRDPGLRSILKKPASAPAPAPSRGHEYRDINIMAQEVFPEKQQPFSQEEIDALDKITIDDSSLEDAVYKRAGMYPAHTEPDPNEEEPDFGDATEDEKAELLDIFATYPIFARHKYDVGKFDSFKVSIDTIPGYRVNQPERDHPIPQQKAADEVIHSLLEAGIVQYGDPTKKGRFCSNWLCQEKFTTKQTSKADKLQKKREDAAKVAKQKVTDKTTPTSPPPQNPTKQARKLKSSQKMPDTSAHPGNSSPEPSTTQNTSNSDKKYRILMDNRELNEISVKCPPPKYPHADMITLKSAGDFCASWDISNSFHSLELTEETRYKSSFWWNGHLLEWTRLQQGWCSSSFYQQMMLNIVFGDQTLQEFKELHPEFDIPRWKSKVLSYSDDYLLMGDNSNRKEYLLFVRATFFCLHKHGLKIARRKTKFFVSKYNFLGSEIDLNDKSIRVQSWKIQAIANWQSPRSRIELASRLACLQYIGSFLVGWKYIAAELFEALKDDKPWLWTLTLERRWNELKFLAKAHLSLIIPHPDHHLVVTADSSQIGMSACLMAFLPDVKKLMPVAFLSRLYSRHVLRRSILAKEATSSGLALIKFERLIRNSNHTATMITDSHSLIFYKNYSKLNAAIFNFSLLLQSFGSCIQLAAVPGELNFLADQLSRFVCDAVPAQMHEDKEELTDINRNLFKFDRTVIFDHNDIRDILEHPPLDYEDIHPSASYKRIQHVQSSVKTIEDVMNIACNPPELAFLRLKADTISDEVRKHMLWAKVKKIRSTKPLTDRDIELLKKKYRMENLDLTAFNYHTDVTGENRPAWTLGPTPSTEYRDKIQRLIAIDDPDKLHLCDKVFCWESEHNKRFIENLETYLNKIDMDNEKILLATEVSSSGSQMSTSKPLKSVPTSSPNPKSLDVQDGPNLSPINGQIGAVASPSSDPNPNEEVFHFRPAMASQFVKHMRKILQITKDNPELLNTLRDYQVSRRADKIKKYKDCLAYAETLAGSEEAEWAVFMPVYTHPEADIVVDRGIDSLTIKMKKSRTIKRGEMLIINFYTMIFMGGPDLYCDPDTDLSRQALLHIPDLIMLADQYNYVHGTYIIPNKELKLNQGDIIFSIRGFQPRFTVLHIEHPICVREDDYNTEVQCHHETYQGHSTVKYLTIPIQSNNQLVATIYEQLKPYFKNSNINLFLSEWSCMARSEGRHRKNKTGLGMPSENKTDEKTAKNNTPPGPDDPLADDPRRNDPLRSDAGNGHTDTGFNTSEDEDRCRRLNNITYINQVLNSNKVFTKDILKFFLTHKDYLEAYAHSRWVKLDNLLYLHNSKGRNQDQLVLVLPQEVAKYVAKFLHEQDGGHINPRQMKETFERQFTTISPSGLLFKNIVENCFVCSFNQNNRAQTDTGVIRSFKPTRSYQVIIIDNMHSLPRTERGMTGALVACCALTNFSFLIPTPSNTQEQMILALGTVFAVFGAPSVCLSDSASCFGGAFSSWLTGYGVLHHRFTTQRSKSVGAAEISIRGLRAQMNRLIQSNPSNKRNWDLICSKSVRTFNLQALYNTKIPRSNLFFGAKSNLYSNETLFFHFDENTISEAKEQLIKLRESRSQVGFNKHFRPGCIVTRHIGTKDLPVDGDSRYFQPTSQQVYKVLDSCPFSCLLRSQNTGALVCVTPSSLRRIDLARDPIDLPHDDRFMNSFMSSKFRQGSQPSYMLPAQNLGPLPVFQPPKIDSSDRASGLVVTESENKNRHSKRLRIAETLNQIYNI